MVMIFVTTRQSTVMVNSGETAHLSCSVQAIFFTITILKIIMTTPFLKIIMTTPFLKIIMTTPFLILKMILVSTALPCRTVRRSTA